LVEDARPTARGLSWRRGAAAAHRLFESWQSVWVEPHEFIEEGEHVVAPSTTHFVGRDGIGVQARGALTFTIRDGMLVHTGLYQDKQEALRALGLEE
jgi:hypothetical protein